MKKITTSVSEHLGITQRDLAPLLGVSRSLVSLFELGKRDLPLHAKLILNDLLLHVNTNKQMGKGQQAVQQRQLDGQCQALEEMIYENGYQLKLLKYQLPKAQQKLAAHQRLLQLTDFVGSRKATASKGQQIGYELLSLKTVGHAADRKAIEAMQQEIKLELLELEKLLLESKLRKLRSILENKETDSLKD